MAKIIGVTGGIGSGKTTLVRYIESLGIPAFIADDEAKKVTLLPEVTSQIKSCFGETIFQNGQLNRQQLGSIVFSDAEKLNQLNSIIHPAVRSQFKLWLDQKQSAPFVVYEAAILFESRSCTICDYIITITAPLEDRINRVMLRDKYSRENVLQRISAQWTDEQRIAKSDFIVENVDTSTARLQIDYILKNLYNQQ